MTSRTLRAVGGVAEVHLALARREAQRDAGRLATGVAMGALAVLFVGFGLTVAHGAVLWALHAYGAVPWLSAFVGVALGDMALAGLFFALAKHFFRKPILRETRDVLQKTVGVLLES